jgi:hypothetical protein
MELSTVTLTAPAGQSVSTTDPVIVQFVEGLFRSEMLLIEAGTTAPRASHRVGVTAEA